MLLNCEHLGVTIRRETILSDISFTVSEGDWLMLVGPNGAGKTTICRAILQALPYTGNIRFLGQDLSKLSPLARARGIAALHQSHQVNYAFTVEELVGLGRYAFGRRDRGAREAIEEALAAVDLLDKRSRLVTTLSGGELQRAFLAQSICQQPKLLLLDEPANHLDLSSQRQIFSLVDSWRRCEGRAVISVVHDLTLARRFATRAVVMHNGKADYFGSPEEAFSNERLSRVYGLNVQSWLQELYQPWEDAK